MAASSVRKSAAFDETYHLTSGYAYLQTGDPRLSWEHPPLAQALAALPLLARDDITPLPLDHPDWHAGFAEGFVDEYLWEDNGARAPELIWAGRYPLMGLTLLFGLALFLAIRETVGEPAAWVALALFCLDPNIVANGRLITNDLPMAGLLFVAVWRLGTYLRRPSGLNLVLAGLAAGLAVATKLSALIVGPLFLLVVLLHRPPEGHVLSLWRRLLALVGMAAVAVVAIWAVFGFEVGPLVEGGIPLPAPTFLRGLPGVVQRVARGTPTFLFGQISETGWWYYFPVIFLLKTPLPTLLLVAVSLPATFKRWRESALWWGPAVIYLAIASASPLQIGYRYILPVLLFVLPLAVSGLREWPPRTTARVGLALLLLWAGIEVALIFPDHLSYVNQLGGGRDNGWQILADMNVDWGQDLPALQEYVEENQVEDLQLSYFGSAYPSAYGIQGRMLPGFSRLLAGPELSGYNPYTPLPGTYAVSATSLRLGMVYGKWDLYRYFQDLTPDGRAGRSILIYHLEYPDDVPVDRAVVIGPDVSAVDPDRLGLEEGHQLVTKWAGPGGFVLAGSGPARYVVEVEVPDSPLVAAVLDLAGPVDASLLLEQIPDSPTPTTPEEVDVDLPTLFEGGPALMGWALDSEQATPGGTIYLVTYWLVEEELFPPLAVFVHLLGEDGIPIAQWDGWPVATDGLEVGDIVILSHPLVIPQDSTPGSLPIQVGLYRPPDGPRLQVAGFDRLLLTTVQVER
jgi:hypothetical protein